MRTGARTPALSRSWAAWGREASGAGGVSSRERARAARGVNGGLLTGTPFCRAGLRIAEKGGDRPGTSLLSGAAPRVETAPAVRLISCHTNGETGRGGPEEIADGTLRLRALGQRWISRYGLG